MSKLAKAVKNRFPEVHLEEYAKGIYQVSYRDYMLILDPKWGFNESLDEINDFIRDVNMMNLVPVKKKLK